MSVLKPKNESYQLPECSDPSDLFRYIACYNEFVYYDTDNAGVTHNEIPHRLFFINRIDVATPDFANSKMRFDGVLFVGRPSDIGTDTNNSVQNCGDFTQRFDDYNFDNLVFDSIAQPGSKGQFFDIVKPLLNIDFARDLRNYIRCEDFEFNINNLRPLYNSVRYTKATNCTGVEVYYSLWI